MNLKRMLDQVAGKPAACVLHTGTQGTIQTVANRLNRINILPTTLPHNLALLIEPPAGEGTKLCSDWDELRKLFEMLDRSKNIGLCLDTQHMFGAGMASFESADSVNALLEGACQISRIGLIHLNDSEQPYRSKRDRHAPIGTGLIWSQDQSSLRQLLIRCHEADVDMVSETHGNFGMEYTLCRSLMES